MKYYEVTFTITAPTGSRADACDLVAAMAGETGFETFEETECGLKGYVQTSLFDRKALDETLQDFPIVGTSIAYTICEADDRDWNESWEEEGFEPILIGDKCLIHDGRHLPTNGLKPQVVVEIDAKLAFGTGNHETTRLIVSCLMDIDLQGKTILDAGCGTGILGIVALKRGAAHATGYDIDEWSKNNACHNAVINCVDDRYEALLGDATILDDIGKTFDIVVANINRNILISDMPRFAKVLKNGGKLLLSGFYTDDVPILKEKATNLNLILEEEVSDNHWFCLSFQKTPLIL